MLYMNAQPVLVLYTVYMYVVQYLVQVYRCNTSVNVSIKCCLNQPTCMLPESTYIQPANRTSVVSALNANGIDRHSIDGFIEK